MPTPGVEAVEAFSDFYNLNKDFVTAGNGSDELISIITSCFLEKGDIVAAFTHDFSMYSFYPSLYENKVLNFKNDEQSLTIDTDKLIEFCNNNNVKMLIFSNPCNPTSLGIEKADVLKIIENISCLVVVDEAYMDFWNQSILDEISRYDNLIVLKTCSKAIGLAGLRFGFAVANSNITKALKAVKSPYNTDLISQKLVEILFSHKDIIKNNISKIINQTELLYKSIKEISENNSIIEKIYEPKTNFVFIKTKYSKEIYEFMLKKSIAIRCFDGYLRITSGSEYENKKLIEALEEYFKEQE